MRLIGLLFILVVCMTSLSAQTSVLDSTNVEELRAMAARLNERFLRKHAEAVAKAQQEGWPIHERGEKGKAFALMWLDDNGKPVYYETDNLNAAKTVSTDDVWPGGSAGFSLEGNGMIAGEWDEDAVRSTHQELTGRIIQQDGETTLSDHSTHVAGTILASGVDANAHGMAPKATLHAYDWDNDDSEMANAASNGLLISNHSYGSSVGWYFFGLLWAGDESISSQEDYKFGFYNDEAARRDSIAYNAPYYLIMKSAGNNRGEGSNSNGHEVDGGADGYDCLGPETTAKNILVVGAVDDIPNGYTQPSDVVMSSFSGWGPTDDGRIKPDLVANGIGVYSSISTGDADYDSYDGTSMATPNATGSLLLMQEHYHTLSGGSYMKAATLKALAIHTADEAGTADGPDYKFGWGLLNTRKAVALIDSVWKDQKEHTIQERSLSNGGTYSLQVYSDGTQPLRVTICWTDPPGTPPAPALDPPDIMLVNDLDLRITSGGSTYYPWKFASPDPNAPSETATTGDNIRDNVEQVYIASPPAGTYTITVSHKGTLYNGGPQAFSLIMSGGNYSDQSLPVSLTAFEATAGNGLVILNWVTESETNNLGFNVYRSQNKDGKYRLISSFKENKNLEGLGNSAGGKDYRYIDTDVKNGQTYWYRLEDVSLAGAKKQHGPVKAQPSADSPLTYKSLFPPERFNLRQNYPNPFNPVTHITVDIARAGQVTLDVYNIRGQKVAELIKGYREAGSYNVTFDGSGLSSGMYFYRLNAPGFTDVKRMLLVK